jgi:hypothetical protein
MIFAPYCSIRTHNALCFLCLHISLLGEFTSTRVSQEDGVVFVEFIQVPVDESLLLSAAGILYNL